jgi:predicted dehydrogenase
VQERSEGDEVLGSQVHSLESRPNRCYTKASLISNSFGGGWLMTESAEKTLGLGVVGIGGWGKNVLRAFSSVNGARVLRICDAGPQRLAAAAGSCPEAKATESFDEVLADSTVDAVALATPAPMHAAMAKAALEAGKHVYVEKPMCLNVADARELVALSDQKNLRLMVGHLLEYHPAVGMLKDIVDSGEIGQTYYMYCERVNLGVVREAENSLWSLAPHDISIILYLFGEAPESVSARGSCYLRPGVEDVVFTNLRFADGRMAEIHTSWLDPHKERKMTVVGSKKMVVFDDMSATEKVRIYDKGAEIKRNSIDAIEAISVRHGEIRIPLVPGAEPLKTEAQHFIDCVREGKTPRSDGRDGLNVVSVLEAASQSLKRDGAPVKISEL